MKNVFENLTVMIKIWLWNRKREKNRVKMTRNLSPYEKLTFYPYESDYERLIKIYCENNTYEFSKLENYPGVHPFVFQLYMQNGEILLGFPVQLSKSFLTLRKEKVNPMAITL